LWFIFTDGEISDHQVSQFSHSTKALELHGISCAVVIFDHTNNTTLRLAHVSVGVSTYALAPNSVLIFHDILSNQAYVMQAKGCFTSLLPSPHDQPYIGPNASWEDFPTMRYEDLVKLHIPPPKELSADQIAFQDGWLSY